MSDLGLARRGENLKVLQLVFVAKIELPARWKSDHRRSDNTNVAVIFVI